MTPAEELVSNIENAGGILTLNGDRLKCQLTEEAEHLLPELQRLRDQVVGLIRRRAENDQDEFQVTGERERPTRCGVHGAKATWWLQPDGSPVCGRCHPDPFDVAVEETGQSCAPPMPEGVRLLAWAPEHPPVAVKTLAVVNDIPQFIRTTLEQLRAATVGENWLAGNWSIRELVDRLEQVGVKVEVTT